MNGMTSKRTPRLERVEQELRALSIVVDGRNARNGYCTWSMIAQGVERCWQLIAAELDGLPDDVFPPAPSLSARQAERHLREAQELVADLSNKLRLVASGAVM